MPIDIPENDNVNPVVDGLFSNLGPEFLDPIEEIVPDHKSPDRKSGSFKVSNPFSGLKTDPDSPKASERPYGNTPAMPKNGLITEKLENLYTIIGMGLMMKDPTCAKAIAENAHEAAASVEALCKANPKVRRIVLGLLETGAWGAVLTAHAPILMAVYSHHKPNRQTDVADETPKRENRNDKSAAFMPHFVRPSTGS